MHDFGVRGVDCKISGAEGALLVNFCDVSPNFFLKYDIASKSLDILGGEFIPEGVSEKCPESVFPDKLNLKDTFKSKTWGI